MAFIQDNPSVRAISSHVVRPPFPAMLETTIYPLLFLRHPILRVASVYKYERSLNGETEAQRVAMQSTFAEYVRWRLRPEVEPVIRDFQTLYISGEQLIYDDPRRATATSANFSMALAILESLAAFGIVEQFADSNEQFQRRLSHIFPEIRWREARENVTGGTLQTLESIRGEIGDGLFDQLREANTYDLTLYAKAVKLFNERRSDRDFVST
jgi:hypothetical protein